MLYRAEQIFQVLKSLQAVNNTLFYLFLSNSFSSNKTLFCLSYKSISQSFKIHFSSKYREGRGKVGLDRFIRNFMWQNLMSTQTSLYFQGLKVSDW